jgi:hypothetical protein
VASHVYSLPRHVAAILYPMIPTHRIASHRTAPLDQRIHARLASRVALPRSPPHPSRVRATLHVLVEMSVEMSVEMQHQRKSCCICRSVYTHLICPAHTYTQRARRGINATICCPLSHLPPSPPYSIHSPPSPPPSCPLRAATLRNRISTENIVSASYAQQQKAATFSTHCNKPKKKRQHKHNARHRRSVQKLQQIKKKKVQSPNIRHPHTLKCKRPIQQT